MLHVACLFLLSALTAAEPPVRTPTELAVRGDGRIAVADRTAGALYLIDGTAVRQVDLPGQVSGVAWTPQGTALAGLSDEAAIVDVGDDGGVRRRIAVGGRPSGIAVTPDGALAVVADYGLHTAWLVDLRRGVTVGQVATTRHPWAVAMAPDGTWAAVGGIVPQGPATRADAASAITLIDLGARSARAQVPLPPGSSNLRGLAVTADGGLLLATHTIGRTSLPTTQLERGWVNTNAVTLIRMPQGRILATLLLDQVDRGAADPWGVALDRDGVAWIGIAGAHRLARLDLPALRRLLAGDASLLPPVPPRSKTPDAWAFWRRLATDPAEIERLAYDMTALHVAGFVRLWDLPVLGPRGIGVLPDGRVVAAGAFSGALALFDPQMPTAAQTLPLGAQAPETPARRGEFLFYDGIHCFQSWLSCSTCHHDTRSDGLVWDLLNDGLGNPKNSKSMLWAMQTEPAMWRGVRASGAVAVRAGFRFQMTTPPEEDVQAVTAYLTGLRPERSPHQVRQTDGTWGQTPAALRGQAIFNDSTVGCTDCHDGPYRSDMRLHDVGTHSDGDPDGRYVTPPLDELWRSGPWLHDGRAARVRDIFTEHNPNDRHGRTRHLSAAQLDDLEAYLLSW